MLTAKEVAHVLKVQVHTVHNYRKQGQLRAIRLGGSGPYRFFADSLERFLGRSVPRERSREELIARDRRTMAQLGIEPLFEPAAY